MRKTLNEILKNMASVVIVFPPPRPLVCPDLR